MTPASLSVSGNRSNSSNSGSCGQSEAWHSARTMRSMASSTVRRVASLNVRTFSCSVACSGMTLLFVPAWMLPTVSTAVSPGATSRATTVCNRTTIIAARTTGSIAACGIELIVNEVGNARAKGQVENAHYIVETHFEAALKLRAPVTSLEEINGLAQQWARAFNATRMHTRTGLTRRDGWLRITAEQLVLAPSIEVMRGLANAAPKPCTVRDGMVRFRGGQFDVRGVPGLVNGQRVHVVANAMDTDGSVRASFGIQLRPDKKYSIAGFVPLSFILPPGVQVTVDGDKKGVLQFVQCNPPIQGSPPGCLAVGDGSDDLIAAMRKGTKMALVVTDRQNQQLPIELSLAGFGTAFDGPGMDPQAAAKAAIQKSKEFQDAAKAAAQRMIDKQRQDTGAAPSTQN